MSYDKGTSGGRHMTIYAFLVALFALLASPQPQQRQKYPWQYADTQCNEGITFCWYDLHVTAYGNRWVSA
jgi:hypothetical protein